MNYHEEELSKSLGMLFKSGEIREIGNSSTYFNRLAELFPSNGSKIDWCKVDQSVEDTEPQESKSIPRFIEFFDKICTKFSLSGDIIYIGDSATEFALRLSLETLRKALPEILSIPQHHYIVSEKYDWCACLTIEGDMGFGFSHNSVK